ncbi:MAG: hypothetical protein ACREQO_08225 [Candidatus Binatia bacterium]
MADSINRLVPSAIALDRAGQFGSERRRNSTADWLRRQDPEEEDPLREAKQETPANYDAEPGHNKIKGSHLDINA